MATDNKGRPTVRSRQAALDAADVSRCPECSHELYLLDDPAVAPEHLYCPVCLDVAYDLDGSPIGQIT